MGRACCVLGCPSGGDVPSHQIPKNPVLFQKWKDMIYSEKMQHMTDEQISKCTVCYRHFSTDDYLITYRVRKLKRGVAPSLNLPNKSANSIESNDIEAKSNIKCESSIKMESGDSMENEEDMPSIVLFEDAPETLDSYLPKYSPEQVLSNEQVDSDMESEFKLYCKRRALRRKRVSRKQLILLRCKKQAERYEETPTIQKIMSLMTADELAAVKAKIRKSRYLPKVYVKIYHNIAKNKALSKI